MDVPRLTNTVLPQANLDGKPSLANILDLNRDTLAAAAVGVAFLQNVWSVTSRRIAEDGRGVNMAGLHRGFAFTGGC